MNWRAIPLAVVLYLNGHFTYADCGASLVTGIDASASVGASGLEMQVAGMSEALQSPQVLQAFQSQGCVRIAVFAWSEGPAVVLLPWMEIGSAEDASRAAAEIVRTVSEYDPPVGVLTDVSGALLVAEALLGQITPTGRQVVNIVSDGEDNVADGPQVVSARLKASGVRVNAVLFGPSATVEQYYRVNVTNGFVLRINGPADFASVYRSKFQMDLS